MLSLERFQAKWTPVGRPQTRQNKGLEHFAFNQNQKLGQGCPFFDNLLD